MADEDPRALLTDREREILLGEAEDVSEKYYYVVVTRVRKRIQQVERDLSALETHETLSDEFREVVCAVIIDALEAALSLGIKEEGFYINDVIENAGLEESHKSAVEYSLKEMAQNGWLRRNRDETGEYWWTLEKQKTDELREALCNGGENIENVE